MKLINLTHGYTARVSDKDYSRVSKIKWFAVVRERTVYAESRLPSKRKNLKMHRFILGITDPKIEVDHKDHNGINNQRRNLRKGTKNDNQHNAAIRRDNTSGFKGVSWYKPRQLWRTQIMVSGKVIHLLYSTDRTEAARAYDAAALKHFGKFACTNEALGLIREKKGTQC